MENVNCETSLTRNDPCISLLTSVLSYTPMQSNYRNITISVLISLNDFVPPNVLDDYCTLFFLMKARRSQVLERVWIQNSRSVHHLVESSEKEIIQRK